MATLSKPRKRDNFLVLRKVEMAPTQVMAPQRLLSSLSRSATNITFALPHLYCLSPKTFKQDNDQGKGHIQKRSKKKKKKNPLAWLYAILAFIYFQKTPSGWENKVAGGISPLLLQDGANWITKAREREEKKNKWYTLPPSLFPRCCSLLASLRIGS